MIEQTPSRPLRIVSSQAAIPPPVSLPPSDTTRWVASRKALVVAAVERGQITIEEAMARYRLSQEEFTAWQCALTQGGVKALRMASMAERQAEQRRMAERQDDLITH